MEWTQEIEWFFAQLLELPVNDEQSLMNSIENKKLYDVIAHENSLTIQIVFLKVMGYNGYEIPHKIGISQKAVNLRLLRLRKKFKKFLKP